MKEHFSCCPDQGLAPQEQLLGTKSARKRFCIGLPKECSGGEKRFPLTPEAIAILTERGIRIFMEPGAGESINYSDFHYTEAGAEIQPAEDVYRCDMVLKLTPLNIREAGLIRPGAVLMTLFQPQYQSVEVLKMLISKKVTALAIDHIGNEAGRCPVADLLSIVDGLASVVVATEWMSNRTGGKGILMGGVPGVASSEVVIIGAGLAGRAAARSALGLGALVRVFDDNFYRLQAAQQEVSPALFTSNMHRNVLENALRTADVVIGTEVFGDFALDETAVLKMKKGALLFDLCMDRGGCFATSVCSEAPCDKVYEKYGVLHYCLSSVGSAVARTASMALSNQLVPMLSELMSPMNILSEISRNAGWGEAVYLHGGKLVNKTLSVRTGLPCFDMNLFMSMF